MSPNKSSKNLDSEKLKESEEELRSIFDANIDGIAYIDTSGKVIRVNKRLMEMMGYKPNKTVGKNISKIGDIDSKDLPRVLKAIREVVTTGKPVKNFEVTLIRKDGKKILTEINTGVVKKDSKVTGIMVVVRDITERKKIEEVLKSSEKKYRALIEQSLEGIFIVRDFRIIFANKAFAKISGYTVKELLSLPANRVKALIHPEYQKMVWRCFQERLLGRNVPPKYVYCGIRKNGDICWLDMLAKVIDYNGRPAIQGTIRDITEQLQTKQKLEESKSRWRSLVLSIPDYVSLLDKDKKFLFLNRYAKGFKKKDVIGKSVYNFITKDSIESFRKNIEKCQNTKKIQNFEHSALGDEGVTRIYEDYAVPIVEKNKLRNIMIISRDITERKKTENEMNKINQELQLKIKELKRFNRMAVGRELRMIELKNKIKNLEKSLKDKKCENV